MIITDSQAKQIANCIAFDISKFIAEHQAEYDAWLKKYEETEVNKK